ncbi:MAG: hypothetical protein ACKOYM_02570 [Actinomycetes bacterium]
MRARSEQEYEHQSRTFARRVFTIAVVIALTITLAWRYVSLACAGWVFLAVAGPFVWFVVRLAPEPPPRSIDEQLELLELLWAQEVPASQAAMVQEYLNDPDAAVRAIVGHRSAISPEAAQQFMASRVTG